MQSMVKSRMSMATWGRWMLVFRPRIVPNPRSAVIVARRVIWQKILARSRWLNQKPNHSLPSLVDVAKVEGKVEERQKEKERETSFEEDKPMDRKLKQWTQPNAFDLCVCFVGLCFVCLVLLGSYFQGNFCPKLDFNPTQNSSSWPTMSRTCPAMREKKEVMVTTNDGGLGSVVPSHQGGTIKEETTTRSTTHQGMNPTPLSKNTDFFPALPD